MCQKCNDGYFMNALNGTCKLCSDEIDGCTKCDNDGYCLECVVNKFPSAEATECQDPFDDCLVDQPEGLVKVEVEIYD